MTRDEAIQMRKQMENIFDIAAASMTNDQAIENRVLCKAWALGVHAMGTIRSVDGYPYKCIQSHDTKEHPDIVPGSTAWPTFWIPLHGTTPETALPFVQPDYTEDRYKAGEYAIFDVGMKKCVRDTTYTYIDDPTAWEDA